MRAERCVCCNGATLDELRHRDQFVDRRLRQCRACRHVQVDTLPDRLQLQHFYANTYSAARGGIVSEPYLRIMRERARAQLDFCERRTLLADCSLLDVGCGYGSLVAEAIARRANASGIDFDPRAVAQCRMRGLDVELVDSELSVVEDITCIRPHLVTFSHSLEHMIEPERVLSACAESLVFIEVPAYDARIGSQFDDQEGHLSFFNRESLERLLDRLQFTVLRLGGFGPDLDFFWRRRTRPLRRLRQAITRDYFFRQYDRARERGIWIRALAKGKNCRS